MTAGHGEICRTVLCYVMLCPREIVIADIGFGLQFYKPCTLFFSLVQNNAQTRRLGNDLVTNSFLLLVMASNLIARATRRATRQDHYRVAISAGSWRVRPTVVSQVTGFGGEFPGPNEL